MSLIERDIEPREFSILNFHDLLVFDPVPRVVFAFFDPPEFSDSVIRMHHEIAVIEFPKARLLLI